MSTVQVPGHLQAWWKNQYQAVREFCQALFSGKDPAGVARTVRFHRDAGVLSPKKMRSVRLTNAAHALWQNVPSKLAFEVGIKHCQSPAEIHEYIQIAQPALMQRQHVEQFEKEMGGDRPAQRHSCMVWGAPKLTGKNKGDQLPAGGPTLLNAPEIRIRLACPDDLVAVTMLLDSCHLPTEDLTAEILATFFVAESAGQPGSAWLDLKGRGRWFAAFWQ